MEREEMWRRLERWQNNQQTKTTRETYLKICEQTGEEVDPDKIPPEFEDLPEDVQKGIITFNKLGDRVVADIGYLGKDYSALDVHIRVAKPDNEDIFLETLLRIDEVLIKKSADEMRQAREKLKKK